MTTPVAGFNVYVPSPGTVTVVCEQPFGVSAGIAGLTELFASPHSFTEVASSGNEGELGLSLANGSIVWLTL